LLHRASSAERERNDAHLEKRTGKDGKMYQWMSLKEKAMKKPPAKRNPMAREIAKAQYRRRIKPDKRRSIEAKQAKRQLTTGVFLLPPPEAQICSRTGESRSRSSVAKKQDGQRALKFARPALRFLASHPRRLRASA
jgi:hypothetical protein